MILKNELVHSALGGITMLMQQTATRRRIPCFAAREFPLNNHAERLTVGDSARSTRTYCRYSTTDSKQPETSDIPVISTYALLHKTINNTKQ